MVLLNFLLQWFHALFVEKMLSVNVKVNGLENITSLVSTEKKINIQSMYVIMNQNLKILMITERILVMFVQENVKESLAKL